VVLIIISDQISLITYRQEQFQTFLKLGHTSGICMCRARSQQQLIEGEWRHQTNNFLSFIFCQLQYSVKRVFRCTAAFSVPMCRWLVLLVMRYICQLHFALSSLSVGVND